MSTRRTSRDRPETLADVLERISTTELARQRRDDMASAVRVVCRAWGRQPGDVPANAQDLRTRLASLTAASVSVTPARWRNIKSLFGAALATTGVTSVSRRSSEPMSDEWEVLLKRAPDSYT